MCMQQPTGKKVDGQVPESGKGKSERKRTFGRPKNESVEARNERLIRWLNSPMDKMPLLAITELCEAGRECMPAVMEALSHSDHNIRANAATVMSQVGGPAELRCLKMALSDRSPAVCAVAEMAIYEIIKRHLKEFDPKTVESMAARLGGAYGRKLDRLLGKDVPEPPRSKGEDEDI